MRSFASPILIRSCKRAAICGPLWPTARPPNPSSQRNLNVAPPFLLDSYTPRYNQLSSTAVAEKRSAAHAHLRNCNLCPRKCAVNRLERAGACLIQGNVVRTGTIAPHFGEEPPIQGHNGSGSVFFSGCNLRCVFCQNHDISHTRNGAELSPEELAEWMVKLQDLGKVHNINFVTPEHVVPQVVLAILAAKDLGLNIPIIYNTSSYDSLESIDLLEGLVDIYLPDFKVWEQSTGERLLKASDYTPHAKEAIKAMYAQVGDLCLTGDNIARSGVLVRHLVMPSYQEEGKAIVKWLAENVSRDVVVHIMEQYHPRAHVGKRRRRALNKDSPVAMQKDKDDVEQVAERGGVFLDGVRSRRDVRYSEINRPIQDEEVQSVRQAAEAAGLWRFIEPAKHGGFNI